MEPTRALYVTVNKTRVPSVQLRQQTDLHAHNQLAEKVPTSDEPPLCDHMQTHLQHLPPIPQPGEPPPWVPEDVIYNDTGQAYHYPQPLRTMAHTRGHHADTTLMTCLQQELLTTLYYSALHPSVLPVHLQKRQYQLLLEPLPLPNRVPRWYSRKGVDLPPKYTICRCHMQTSEMWDHFTKCPLAQDDVPLATWRPEDRIKQHAGWGPAALPTNEIRRVMRKPQIKEANLRGTVPLEIYQVLTDNAARTKATVSHMRLTAIKRADAQLQHRTQLYIQGAQHTRTTKEHTTA